MKYRTALPQLDGELYLTDGGIETTLIFQEGLELPLFAAFDLLKTEEGTAALRKCFEAYANLAKRFGTGFILESATWRANPDWASRIGYSEISLDEANRKAIAILEEIRGEFETAMSAMVISGCVGPRGDGYVPGALMTPGEAEAYHSVQIRTFADTAADMISAITINYVEEAVGITTAARNAGMPVAISFTVETDGHLPTGQSLRAAIAQVDEETSGYPAYYMINCAHPTHFERIVAEPHPWLDRIHGVRANASKRSHAELNDAADLDSGDPVELGHEYADLKRHLPRLNVMGGCCGTDDRHIEQIAEACAPLFSRNPAEG